VTTESGNGKRHSAVDSQDNETDNGQTQPGSPRVVQQRIEQFDSPKDVLRGNPWFVPDKTGYAAAE
jgi:hypothetical protein